jgi:hypothetical protein
MVQISACVDIGPKILAFLIGTWKDRFNMAPEMIGKPIGCEFFSLGGFLWKKLHDIFPLISEIQKMSPFFHGKTKNFMFFAHQNFNIKIPSFSTF